VAQAIRTPSAPAPGGRRVGDRGRGVCACRSGNHGRGGIRRQAGELLGTERRFRLHVRRRRRRRRRCGLGIQSHADDADRDSDDHSSDSVGHTEHIHDQLNSGNDEHEDHDDDNRDDDATPLDHQLHRNCSGAYSDDITALIRSASTPDPLAARVAELASLHPSTARRTATAVLGTSPCGSPKVKYRI
jgi:hypothetical protein